jgi:DNA-binding SARP family transcriptional activator
LLALERRIEADLALGHHDRVLGELQELVARDPVRERLRAQLMLALYRSGRQAEAPCAFRPTRWKRP